VKSIRRYLARYSASPPDATHARSPDTSNASCFLLGLLVIGATETRADSCPSQPDEIATDRPDVTNSSLVVPVGSFQSENGVNLSARDGGRILDETNTRWRVGVAPCLEVLVDLPSYLSNLRSPRHAGFTDVAPAVKWQISSLPGSIDLSMVVGVALPTGAVDIAGRGDTTLSAVALVAGAQ
jgi:hypothetical protein